MQLYFKVVVEPYESGLLLSCVRSGVLDGLEEEQRFCRQEEYGMAHASSCHLVVSMAREKLQNFSGIETAQQE